MIYDETGIHGVFALFDGAEPTYAHIEEGEWLNDEPYVTIHRLAGDGRVHGLFLFEKNTRLRERPNLWLMVFRFHPPYNEGTVEFFIPRYAEKRRTHA